MEPRREKDGFTPDLLTTHHPAFLYEAFESVEVHRTSPTYLKWLTTYLYFVI